ncbi:MFS transporter [Paenibacillus sp. UNC499MF]|uniref:MFS transporter n=1 Tax=Paenibacillus sp. UNC499MF TaxID=1502751 RepID=UPI0008A023F3|nr:MFS transporter [Paenibacillus sp. UNC499MF]SEG42888.1 MFS transporter, ACDE family, multidrug resistance protein [Paenibacillus sp. UNC499MF]
MEAKKKWDLISVASIPLIMTLGNSMLIPILPLIREKLHVTSFQVSLLITVYSIAAIILIPVAGFLSDRYGRKVVIIPSLIIAGIGGAVCGFAAWFMPNPYITILLGRLLQGIGAAGAAPVAMPLVGDMFTKESDVSSGLGVIETANTGGKVLSPILGSALAAVIWFLPFMAIPVFCLISVLMVLFLVKKPEKNGGKEAGPDQKKAKAEEKRADKTGKPAKGPSKKSEDTDGAPISLPVFLKDLKWIFSKNGRWLYAIFAIGCICMFLLFGALFYLSELLEEKYKLHGILKGCVLAIPLTLLCLTSFITGKIIGQHKKRMKWLTFIGSLLALGATVGCLFFNSLYGLLTMLSLLGIGIGLALPCLDAFITAGIDKAQRGTISSFYSSMRFIGVAIGPPVVSVLLTKYPGILFYVLGAACLLAALLALFAIHPSTDEEPRPKPEASPA